MSIAPFPHIPLLLLNNYIKREAAQA